MLGTIGPACQSADMLGELLQAGMTGARFDLTWGPLAFHRKSLDNLQARSGAGERWDVVAGAGARGGQHHPLPLVSSRSLSLFPLFATPSFPCP